MPIFVLHDIADFATWLQMQLQQHNIKQIKFAQLCNITRSTLCRYLSGDRIPSPSKQESIIDGLCKISDMDSKKIADAVLWHCHISHTRRQ